MSYVADDTSPSAGQPIELYLIKGPARAYRYTSHTEAVSYAGQTYEPLPMARSSVQSATETDPPVLTVEMPYDTPFVRAYAFGVPPSYATLTVRRYHPSSGPAAGVTYFSGSVSGISIRGRTASVEAVTTAEQFGERVPSIIYSRSCNHILYGPRCQVDVQQYRVNDAVVVESVSADGLTITVSTVSPIPALQLGLLADPTPEDYLRFGSIIRVQDGESRFILNNNGADEAVLTIRRAFADLEVGDAVVLQAGCDQTIGTCASKFNNTINFGGHPQLPRRGIFGIDIRELF